MLSGTPQDLCVPATTFGWDESAVLSTLLAVCSATNFIGANQLRACERAASESGVRVTRGPLLSSAPVGAPCVPSRVATTVH